MTYQKYIQSQTGLLHLRDRATTVCDVALEDVDPDLHPIADDWAEEWLADHPWDLCRNCKAAVA